MKKLRFIISIILIIFSLIGCNSSSDTYTVNVNNTAYTVDPVKSTINDGEYTYSYKLYGSSSGYKIEIRYPNDATYYWQTQSSGHFTSGHGGWSDNYDDTVYADGQVLISVLENKVPKENSKNIPLILLLLAVGAFNTFYPYGAWYLEHGWKYKNAEPSDTALMLNIVLGVLLLIIAFIMIIA